LIYFLILWYLTKLNATFILNIIEDLWFIYIIGKFLFIVFKVITVNAHVLYIIRNIAYHLNFLVFHTLFFFFLLYFLYWFNSSCILTRWRQAIWIFISINKALRLKFILFFLLLSLLILQFFQLQFFLLFINNFFVFNLNIIQLNFKIIIWINNIQIRKQKFGFHLIIKNIFLFEALNNISLN